MPTTKSFSLYLAKENIMGPDEILSEKAHSLIRERRADRIVAPNFGDGAILYTFPGEAYPPKWAKILAAEFGLPNRLYSQSPCAVLAFGKSARIFAITFSFGHVYLDDTK